MRTNKYLLNIILSGLLTLGMLLALVARIFVSAIILPKIGIPNLVLLSLVALLLDHFLTKGSARCYPGVAALALLSFLVLPWAAGFAGGLALVKLSVVGCVVFTAVTWLFDSMISRLASGYNTKTAAVVSALGIYLASQAFAGMIL